MLAQRNYVSNEKLMSHQQLSKCENTPHPYEPCL